MVQQTKTITVTEINNTINVVFSQSLINFIINRNREHVNNLLYLYLQSPLTPIDAERITEETIQSIYEHIKNMEDTNYTNNPLYITQRNNLVERILCGHYNHT